MADYSGSSGSSTGNSIFGLKSGGSPLLSTRVPLPSFRTRTHTRAPSLHRGDEAAFGALGFQGTVLQVRLSPVRNPQRLATFPEAPHQIKQGLLSSITKSGVAFLEIGADWAQTWLPSQKSWTSLARMSLGSPMRPLSRGPASIEHPQNVTME